MYDIFYTSSPGDIGTMYSNMNIINCVNAKTSNVLDNLNSCKDYVNMETDAFITAAVLRHFSIGHSILIRKTLGTQRKEVGGFAVLKSLML